MELGKPKRRLLASTVWRLTGARSSEVISGPSAGVDVSVLRVGSDEVMLANCDPISLLPSIGPADSAKMSVYEVSSDVSTTGHSPRFAMFDLNLPPTLTDRSLTEYWKSINSACLELGVTIVGGHTGRFEGCDYSIVGSATMWATSGTGDYVTSDMAKSGDDLIITKGAGFGATAVLAHAFPKTVRKALGHKLFDEARKYFPNANTVKDAVTAASIGIRHRGVSAMHDATEGGVVAAIIEMAEASRLGGTVAIDDIPISEETRQISRLFRIDPLVSLGEGSLVIACKQHKSRAVIEKLRTKNIPANIVGRLTSKSRAIYGVNQKGRVKIRYPSSDPYWKAYWRAVRRSWS